MRWTTQVHLFLDVEAESEEEARAITRERIAAIDGRLSVTSSPGHSVEGVRVVVPMSERVVDNRLAEELGVGPLTVEYAAQALGIRPCSSNGSGGAIYLKRDAKRISERIRLELRSGLR